MAKTDKIKQFLKVPGKKELVALVFVGLLILFTIIFSTIVLVYRHGKVKVMVRVAPRDAALLLNDTPIKNNKSIYLEPGNYTLVATRDHFNAIEMDFTISKDLPYVAATMTPKDDEGVKYLDDNPSEFRRAESLVGVLLSKAGELERERYPIIKQLPINNRFYSISYSYPNFQGNNKDNGAPAILVKSDSSYLDAAVSKLKSFEGVSLIDYEINFNIEERFNSPVKSTSSNPETFLKETYKNSGFTLSTTYELSDEYTLGIFVIKDKYSLADSAKHLALIKKEGNSWKAVSTPKPLLTKFNTPNTPEDILNSANNYAGQ